jgi:hypothetical protein
MHKKPAMLLFTHCWLQLIFIFIAPSWLLVRLCRLAALHTQQRLTMASNTCKGMSSFFCS